MANSKVSGRYAKSLMDLAVEKGQLEAVYADARLFIDVAADRNFYLMMKSPIIKADKKIRIFEAIFATKLNELTMAFFRIVITKGREFLLREIMQEVIAQYNALKGITAVKFTSAVAVDDTVLNRVKEMITRDGQLKTIEWQTAVNENLIGGFVLEFDNKLFDASVLHDLKSVKKQFLENNYIRKY